MTTIKNRVQLSSWCGISTLIVLIVLAGLAIFMLTSEMFPAGYVFAYCLLLIAFLCISLYYVPMAISVDGDTLHIHRSLRIKNIPIKEISEVRLCPPTMGEIRLCGSGGFMGHWGWFKERDLGKYFAYYGKSSDCFLVRLKNGNQYMLGCRNPEEIIGALEERMNQQ